MMKQPYWHNLLTFHFDLPLFATAGKAFTFTVVAFTFTGITFAYGFFSIVTTGRKLMMYQSTFPLCWGLQPL